MHLSRGGEAHTIKSGTHFSQRRMAVMSVTNMQEEMSLYQEYRKLLRQVELLDLQEEYVKEEYRSLKRELVRAQEEVKRIQAVPLLIGQFLEPIDAQTAIVSSTSGSNHIVKILSTVDRELLKPSTTVALHRHSSALVDVLPPEADSSIALLGEQDRPDVSYSDIGGLVGGRSGHGRLCAPCISLMS